MVRTKVAGTVRVRRLRLSKYSNSAHADYSHVIDWPVRHIEASSMRDSLDCKFDILIRVCGHDRDEAILSELISALKAGFDHSV